MGNQKHIIRKLILEIGLPTREEATAVQNKLSDEYRKLILDIIEEIFDRLVGEEEVLQIDKLEIDLGEISTVYIDYEFPAKLKTQMEEALVKLLYEVRNSPQGTAGVRIVTSAGDTITVNANVQQRSLSQLETLIYFLEFGVMPWTTSRKQKISLQEMIANAMENHPDQLRKELHQLHRKRHIFRRLSQQLGENQAYYLVAILGCNFASRLSIFSTEIQQWFQEFCSENKNEIGNVKQYSPARLNQRIIEETLFYFSAEENDTIFFPVSLDLKDPETRYVFFLFERLLSLFKIETKLKPIKYPAEISDVHIKVAVLELIKIKKKEAEENAVIEKKMNAEKVASKEAVQSVKSGAPQKNSEETISPEITEEDLPETPEAEDGIYVENAGLVIIAPYLPAFFNHIGLIRDRKFADDDSKYKAIHLLQWMVYGDPEENELIPEKSEHDFVLNKIICGMDIAEPVPLYWVLSDTEKKEAADLLNGIIANWEIIKRTSIPTLRITFLQKEGKLTRQNHDWHLFIHRDSAVEILIDRIPWAISMIRNSWSKETINVEW